MFDKVSLGKRVENFTVEPQYDAYEGVIVYISEDKEAHEKGLYGYYGKIDGTGRRMEVTVPVCPSTDQAREIARNIYNGLIDKKTGQGYQYSPYTATDTGLPPYFELGDGVSIGDKLYSGIYKQTMKLDTLCLSDIAAPSEEIIDHEIEYVSETDRKVQRQLQRQKDEYSSNFEINANAIKAEVKAREDADETFSSALAQTAKDINAEVSKKVSSDGTATMSKFGWKLTAEGFILYSQYNTVFKCDKDGVVVTGKVQATTGYIGGASGFTIDSNKIYNGIDKFTNEQVDRGVYIGTDGIRLGKNFSVSQNGTLKAKSVDLTGNINATSGKIAGFSIGKYTIDGREYSKMSAGNLSLNSDGSMSGSGWRIDANGNAWFSNSGNSFSGSFGGYHTGDIADGANIRYGDGSTKAMSEWVGDIAAGKITANVVTTSELYAKIAGLNSVKAKSIVCDGQLYVGSNLLLGEYRLYVSNGYVRAQKAEG